MPKAPSANEIRQSYLDFFAKKYKHTVVPSSSLVPGGDATLLFTNSGMVQFKDVFLGTDKRPYKRAVDSQKCLRVAGKHNDLEDVGFDNTHHTFFEMLGNWSFGDYYKKEAVAWAWELLTKEWKLPKDKLYLTVFKDDLGEIPTDDEAAEAWANQPGVDKSHIIYSGRKDNFWEMADTGPCGPNSEIHFDFGPERGELSYTSDGQVNLDGPRFVEIWNLVFIQYNRTGPTTLKPLPAKHIDTGMGFERIVSILQSKDSNYRTDLFTPIIAKVQKLVGHSNKQVEENFTPYRVIADHSRAATFLIADGVVPGNVGRNYITRMIIRRAARFGSKIGLDEPFMASLAEVIIQHYGEAYPELVKNKKTILKNLTREEEAFQRAFDKGLSKLDDLISEALRLNRPIITGQDAFKLSSTDGFPYEITRDIARERGLEIDEAGFRSAMETHKQVSVGGEVSMSGELTLKVTRGAEFYTNLLKKLIKSKKIAPKGIKYDPYGALEKEGSLLALLVDGIETKRAKPGDKVSVLLPATPFYVASGGQISDTGEIRSANGKKSWAIKITDTQQPAAGAVVHVGEVTKGNPKVGDNAVAEVDRRRRLDIMRNHTATHLLHAALQQIVGEHARQAGSLVAPDRLRFDFNHSEGLTKDQIVKIEDQVNEWILDNYAPRIEIKSLEKAKNEGAMALFGEKYGAEVRTIAIGDDEPFSYELCGGTHVAHTGDIGLFLIVSEGSAAAGIRRIEAVTGHAAYDSVKERNFIIAETARILKAAPDQVPAKALSLQTEVNQLSKQVSELRRAKSSEDLQDVLANVPLVAGVRVLSASVPDAGADELRHLADRFRQQHRSGVALLAGTQNGRATLIAAITKDLVARGLHAGDLVKLAAEKINGSGGGKPELAQAGGTDNGKLSEVLALAAPWVEEKLGA